MASESFRSHRTKQFRKLFDALPAQVQQQAEDAYTLFKQNPRHPSLNFSPVLTAGVNAWSVKVGEHYRALGVLHDHSILWTWIGSHQAYNRIVKQRR